MDKFAFIIFLKGLVRHVYLRDTPTERDLIYSYILQTTHGASMSASNSWTTLSKLLVPKEKLVKRLYILDDHCDSFYWTDVGQMMKMYCFYSILIWVTRLFPFHIPISFLTTSLLTFVLIWVYFVLWKVNTLKRKFQIWRLSNGYANTYRYASDSMPLTTIPFFLRCI